MCDCAAMNSKFLRNLVLRWIEKADDNNKKGIGFSGGN
jgi:hypothetical protein